MAAPSPPAAGQPPGSEEGDEAAAQATPALLAALSGPAGTTTLDGVRELLDRGADPNAKDVCGRAPLHLATRDDRVLSLLLARGANASAVDGGGASAVLLAALKGHGRAVRVLADDGGAPVGLPDAVGRTPLSAAARGGHLEAMRALLDRGAAVDPSNSFGDTPLFAALEVSRFAPLPEERRAAAVALLLERGASVASVNAHGRTPLHRVARGNACGLVAMLLDRGADPDARDDDGLTPLAVACGGGAVDAAKLLLDRGAGIEAACAGGRTPLFAAAAARDPAAVEALLARGADPNASDADGRSPLDLVGAFAGRGLEAAAALVEGGARPGAHGAAMVQAAVREQRDEPLDRLRRAGVGLATEEALAAAVHAALQRAPRLVRAVLAMAPDGDAGTPLVHAVWRESAAVIVRQPEALAPFLEAGVPLDGGPGPLLALAARTAMDHAPAVLKLLLDAGARAGAEEALRAMARRPGKGPAEAARALLQCGAHPETAVPLVAAAGPMFEAVRDGMAPLAAAVRDTMLRATGDRDATRLVMAFYSPLTPLGVPLGELAATLGKRRRGTDGEKPGRSVRSRSGPLGAP